MELIDIMMHRRSIRHYIGEAIPEEKLDRIIQAGLLAPTSRNRRPCEFYVITDRECLKALSEAKEAGAAFLKDAAAAIAVFADEDISDTWIEDSSIALTYMDLMAVDQGIGSCWIQMHLRKDANGEYAEANCRRLLNLPDHYRITGILALGISAGDKNTVLKSIDDNKIHRI